MLYVIHVWKQGIQHIYPETNQKDSMLVKELIKEGKVKPFIDKTYSLSEVPKALQYFEKGHSRGKVTITI